MEFDNLYDITGKVVEVNDIGGKYSYGYDRIGRVIDVIDPESRTVSYDYDILSRRTKLTYPDDTYITYEYDQLSRLTKIKDQNDNTIAHYNYDALSRRTLLTLANDANAVYEYDISNRLTKLSNHLDDTNSIVFEYTNYDKVGNRRSIVIDSNQYNFVYDKLYQLRQADFPGIINDVNYAYDVLGNRTAVIDSNGTTAYLHNTLNQYDQVGATAYNYDDNGNLFNDGTFKYYYDCENHLTDVNTVGNVKVAKYAYDYLGRRVKKKAYNANGQLLADIHSAYDGLRVLEEYDNVSGYVWVYVYGPGIDEMVCMIRSSEDSPENFYYQYDPLGSVVAISGYDSIVRERYSYDAYGKPTIYDADGNTISQSAYGNRFMFTGREYDAETGNYYYRSRYYNPRIGRFLQTDPIWSVNLYPYCGNNPVMFIDPWGRT